MAKQVVILLPKSPRPKKGRIGSDEKQNWFQACMKAVELASFIAYQNSDALPLIIIPSSFIYNTADRQRENLPHKETDFYKNYLSNNLPGSFKYPVDKIWTTQIGHETISQIKFGIYMACYHRDNLEAGEQLTIHLIWPCPEHYLRWWSIKNLFSIPENVNIKHVVNFKGRPRPKEFIADIVLAFTLPILKLIGKIDWYQEKVNTRRQAGKI